MPTSARERPRIPDATARARWPARPDHQVALLIAVTAAIRLVLASAIGLGVDESYAAAVARPFSLSYFDHPPLAFWIAGAMESVSRSPVVLRAPFIALFALTTWLTYRLGARLFGERAGVYAAVILNLAPVFAVSTGSWVLPDGPLLVGQLVAAVALASLTVGDSPTPRRDWLLVGVGAGIALLSKYHAALFLTGALVWCLTSSRGRAWLRRPEPYAALALAVAMALPVLLWNGRHDWASFRFQLGRAGDGRIAPVVSLLQNLGGQAGYLLPWIFVPLALALLSALRAGPRDARRWFLACLATPPVALFTLLSLSGRPGLPHWTAPGWLFAVPLAGAWLANLERRVTPATVRRACWWAAMGLVAPVAIIVSQASTGWITRLRPAWFAHGDPSLDLVDWTQVPTALAARGWLADDPTVVTTHWLDAGKLGFVLPERVRCLGGDPRHFGFLPPRDRADTLLVLRSDAAGHPLGDSTVWHERAGNETPLVVAIGRDGSPGLYLVIAPLHAPATVHRQ